MLKNILSDNLYCHYSIQFLLQTSKNYENYLELDIKIHSKPKILRTISHGAMEHNNKDSSLFSIR